MSECIDDSEILYTVLRVWKWSFGGLWRREIVDGVVSSRLVVSRLLVRMRDPFLNFTNGFIEV